jgi:hypothetical protein
VTAVHAQAPQSTPVEKPSPLSAIAHDLTNWLSRVTGSRADHHPPASTPPLPRPRPAQPASAPVVSNERPAEVAPAAPVPAKKIVTPVQIND